jgi:NADPH-dependent 7-cyano-7-deazaguanine reductase QueF
VNIRRKIKYFNYLLKLSLCRFLLFYCNYSILNKTLLTLLSICSFASSRRFTISYINDAWNIILESLKSYKLTMILHCIFHHRCSFKLCIKMKNKLCHTVATIPKSNIKIVERGRIDTHSTQTYMTTHFPGLVQTLQ